MGVWVGVMVQEDMDVEVRLKLYSLPVLLYKLASEENKSTNTSLSMSSLLGCDTNVPTISIAAVQLLTETPSSTLLGCPATGRQDVEASQCTTTMVNRWSYMMFSLCCPLYS